MGHRTQILPRRNTKAAILCSCGYLSADVEAKDAKIEAAEHIITSTRNEKTGKA